MSILWFIIGLMLGGMVGVFTMCLFQINRGRDDRDRPSSPESHKNHENDHEN